MVASIFAGLSSLMTSTFSDPALWTYRAAPSDPGIQVRVIYRERGTTIVAGTEGAEYETTVPTAALEMSAVPGLRNGHRLTSPDGTTYMIRSSDPDGSGLIVCALSRA
ncbi:MAG: head-tail joining protein [Niveispirillum sp.]|uniref:head-tail joining protein n=1 Tax=Niveispirillum sp. TaxID=1917217 RepID=UPI0040364005